MKVLTFLGTGRYEPVTYVWRDERGERSYTSHLFPEAVARIFKPEKVLVFVTPQAKTHEHFQVLSQQLGDLLQPVDIPEGKSEAELWEIFDHVAASVEENDAVLLDITHAFRSIPMIVFAVAAYLRRTKSVTIERIIYGAYEARENGKAPIFDLTPLLDLLDWLNGAEFFLQRSDATLLADRLRSIHQQAWKTQASSDLPKQLKSVAKKLENLSQALHLAHPRDVMHFADELKSKLKETTSEVQRWAKPFAVILEQVRSEVARFAYDEPERLDRENYQKQLMIIEHLVEKGLLVQAILLAREWVVSWVILQKGDFDWLNRDHRQEVEKALGAAGQRVQQNPAEVPVWFEKLPKSDDVAELWSQISQLRNDLAHCGMSRHAVDVKRIKQEDAKEILQQLKELIKSVQ
ncbi:MAG: hypothetical protein PWQ22_670 [Archaeoglobaceae archaeon]|nr:hypothetical protein [Archaeoglobaceae archaeon]